MERLVAREGLQDMEVVEVSPPYDVADITALLGGRVIMDVLATLIEAGKRGRVARGQDETSSHLERSSSTPEQQ